MLPFLTESFGNPSSAHSFGRTARAALDDAHERLAATTQRRGARDRLHLRRHRGQQPRAQGRRLGRQGARPPHRDLVDRAPRRRPHAALPREVRVRDRRAAGRPLRPGRPGPARGGAHRPDDPGLDHARQQRGRHDPADRRDRRAGARPQGRPAPRRCRPGRAVRRPRRARRSARISSRSARTSSRARRASARCTSATGPTSSRSSRAAPRSVIAGPGPRTSPARSAWPRPTSCRAPSDPRPSPAFGVCATGSRRPSSPSPAPS